MPRKLSSKKQQFEDDLEKDEDEELFDDDEDLGEVDYFVSGSKIKQARTESKVEFENRGPRVPKVFLKEDEPKILWFNRTEAVGAIWQHWIPGMGRGKGSFALCYGTSECPLCNAGMNRQMFSLFPCVDEVGFEIQRGDRAGDKVTWHQGILELGNGPAEALVEVLSRADLRPDDYDLDLMPIEGKRKKVSGKWSWTFQWEPPKKKIPQEIKDMEWFTEKDVREFYPQPDLSMLRKIAARYGE